jgi:hypothetical protein
LPNRGWRLGQPWRRPCLLLVGVLLPSLLCMLLQLLLLLGASRRCVNAWRHAGDALDVGRVNP